MIDTNIEKRIEKLGRLFKGMQVATDDSGQNVIYVTVSFPQNWMIADDLAEKYGVTALKGEGNEYYFAAELSLGFDTIFDAIEYNVQKMRTALERAELLKAKTAELHNLFADESISLDQLKTMRFTFDEQPTQLVQFPQTDTVNVPDESEKGENIPEQEIPDPKSDKRKKKDK